MGGAKFGMSALAALGVPEDNTREVAVDVACVVMVDEEEEEERDSLIELGALGLLLDVVAVARVFFGGLGCMSG